MRMCEWVSVDRRRGKFAVLFIAVCTGVFSLISLSAAPLELFAATPSESPKLAHTPSSTFPNAVSTPTPPTASKIPARRESPISRNAVLSFLNAAIGWYRHLDVEQTLATEPTEMLYYADDREMAQKALGLGFDYARAQIAQLQAIAPLTERHASSQNDSRRWCADHRNFQSLQQACRGARGSENHAEQHH